MWFLQSESSFRRASAKVDVVEDSLVLFFSVVSVSGFSMCDGCR